LACREESKAEIDPNKETVIPGKTNQLTPVAQEMIREKVA